MSHSQQRGIWIVRIHEPIANIFSLEKIVKKIEKVYANLLHLFFGRRLQYLAVCQMAGCADAQPQD